MGKIPFELPKKRLDISIAVVPDGEGRHYIAEFFLDGKLIEPKGMSQSERFLTIGTLINIAEYIQNEFGVIPDTEEKLN